MKLVTILFLLVACVHGEAEIPAPDADVEDAQTVVVPDDADAGPDADTRPIPCEASTTICPCPMTECCSGACVPRGTCEIDAGPPADPELPVCAPGGPQCVLDTDCSVGTCLDGRCVS